MKIIEGYEKARLALSRGAPSAISDERERLVREIIENVRFAGDAALLEYTLRFDGVKLKSLEVSQKEIQKARQTVSRDLLGALELAAKRIAAFHVRQKKALVRDGLGKLGWTMRPLDRVGVYTPGGTAPLPSSLLMTAIPAKAAGVKEIILATPPGKNGKISPVILAAASLAGIDRVFSVGGAQAVAALAYGTQSVPRVDKVCGPGNIYVFLAKRLVFGQVGIDGLYGPTEVFIIADGSANAAYIAADLLAQAEHGSGASAVLVTTSRPLAAAVNNELAAQQRSLTRAAIVKESLENRGALCLVNTIEEAIDLANLYAPEHLCLVIKTAEKYAPLVRHAGCLFIGENSLEALVDYVAGPSHVLPTAGTARFASPLNILDFVKLMTVVNTTPADTGKLGKAAAVLARAEGLDAHARAVEMRLKEK